LKKEGLVCLVKVSWAGMISSGAMELCRIEPLNVVPSMVSVSELVLDQNTLFALLDMLELQDLAAMKLDGVAEPLSMVYKLGNHLPRPTESSILLYKLCASMPVP